MDIKDIRQKNLLQLQKDYIFRHSGTGKADFALAVGLVPSQLSQLTSDKGVRSLGNALARRIESKLGLPYGWMDMPQWMENIPWKTDKQNKNNIQKQIDGSLITTIQLQQNNPIQTFKIDVLDNGFTHGFEKQNEMIRAIEIDPEEAKRMFGGRKDSTLKIVTATGDSMLKSIAPGELVILDVATKQFLGDGIYAFEYGGSFHIKRLQRIKERLIVISDNSVYDKWEVTEQDEHLFHIRGFVIGKWNISYTRLG